MRLGLCLFLWLVSAATLSAFPRDLFLALAEREFAEGAKTKQEPEKAQRHFRTSADAYRTIIENHTQSAALYENLGKAEYLAGRLPQAIMAWRQGLRIDPTRSTLWQCLHLAREQVNYPESGRPPIRPWYASMPAPNSFWPWLVLLLGHCLCCGSFLIWWLTRRWRWLILGIFLLALDLALAAGMYHWQSEIFLERSKTIAVIVEDTPLRMGNGTSYPTVSKIPEVRRGMECYLRHRQNGWVQIEFQSGVIGWVPDDSVFLSNASE